MSTRVCWSLVAALPLVKLRAERDRQVQVALVHAALAIAATIAQYAAARREDENACTRDTDLAARRHPCST
jgi:hypothetical protein